MILVKRGSFTDWDKAVLVWGRNKFNIRFHSERNLGTLGLLPVPSPGGISEVKQKHVFTNTFRESQLAHQLVPYRHAVFSGHRRACLSLVFRPEHLSGRIVFCNVFRVRIFRDARLSPALLPSHF